MSEFEVLEHVTHDKEQEIIIQKLLTNTTTAVNCIANTGLSYQVPRKKTSFQSTARRQHTVACTFSCGFWRTLSMLKFSVQGNYILYLSFKEQN